MRFEGRYTILGDGPATVVAAREATQAERTAAYPRFTAREIVRLLCREAGRGVRGDLVEIHRLLVGDSGQGVRQMPTGLATERVLDAVDDGRLLVVKDWPWIAGYPGTPEPNRAGIGAATAPPVASSSSAASPRARSAPSPSPADHKVGHLHLASRTAAKDPGNRSRITIGVGERVRVTPSGATGVLKWGISGSSLLLAGQGVDVTLIAHARAETTTVTVKDACGCTQ